MEKLRVERDGERDLVFTGEEIASAWTSPDSGHSNYSGSPGRSRVLTLYRTKTGKFVCAVEQRTQWQGERDRHRAEVCATEAEVCEFFGHDKLAKEIYREAKIDVVEDLDAAES